MLATLAQAPRRPWPILLQGGLLIGALDLVFVFSFWGVGYGVVPTRILHSIAAGLQGTAAFQGGAGSAWLGAACHFLIAFAMVLAYYLVSRRWRGLIERPLAWGAPYGLLLYGLMTYVIVPLSNAPDAGRFNLAWTASSVAMHLLIGVLCAYSARRARRLE